MAEVEGHHGNDDGCKEGEEDESRAHAELDEILVLPSNNHCTLDNKTENSKEPMDDLETMVSVHKEQQSNNHSEPSEAVSLHQREPSEAVSLHQREPSEAVSLHQQETDSGKCENLEGSENNGSDSFLSMPALRKDDSGISMEKSRNDSDASQNDSEAVVTSISHISVSSEDANFKLGTETENNSMNSDAVFRKAPSSVRQASSSVLDSDDDSDSEHEQIKRTRTKCRRRRIRDSTDSDDEEQDSSTERATADAKSKDSDHEMASADTTKSDSDSDTDPDEVGKQLKHSWYALKELRRREYGWLNSKSQDTLFRVRTYSSLQMVQRLKQQYCMESHEGCVNALHFNREGTLLASGSDDFNIVLWDWTRNKPALKYDSGHRNNVFQAKFMPYSGDCHVVSCARDGKVRLAELSSTMRCKSSNKLVQHRGAAHKLALLDSPHIFLSCGEDAVTFEIDLRQERPNKMCITKESGRKVALYSIHANPVNSVEYCVGGRDHFVRVYDRRMVSEDENPGPVKKFCPLHLINSDIKANVTCAVYSYNGSEILGTYNDEDIYLFDSSHSDGADCIHRYSGHRNNNTVKGVNFYGPHSEYIVSGSDCGNVFLWDKETEKIVQYFHGDDGGVVNVLEPHPHAPILATSGLDHDVKIWAPTAEEPTDLSGLKQLTKQNKKEREEERSNEPEVIDGQMMWFLMSHLRRTARRQARHDVGDYHSSSDNSSSESEDEDEDDAPPESMQCVPS